MKTNQILQSPEGDAGASAPGGGQVATAAPASNAPPGSDLFPEPTTAEPVTPTTRTESPVEDEPATAALRSPALTKDDIAELVSSINVSRQAPEPVAQPQQPLTEQQLEQMFNVWKPSADFITQLRNESPETAMQAITAMRDGMIKQAMSMAEYRVQQLLSQAKQELTGQITPLTEYVSTARATAFRDDFFGQNPDLEPYEQLVDAVAAKLYQAGGDGFLKLDRAARMKLFADESKKLVQHMEQQSLTKGGAPAGGNGGSAAQPATRRMSTLTSGGQPGRRGAGGGKFSTGNKHVDDGLAALD